MGEEARENEKQWHTPNMYELKDGIYYMGRTFISRPKRLDIWHVWQCCVQHNPEEHSNSPQGIQTVISCGCNGHKDPLGRINFPVLDLVSWGKSVGETVVGGNGLEPMTSCV